ncbi:hypothetical protein K402DRAFT_69464 [Aulographum hederae CBS 113979]|uniref:Zn(2)-C6 fungal-type domain-containing protein n=1 Tax=Aulographum hederae CBS 113979 TaxID=1176131 RepID=A0A6G1HFC9_9PEZI|nr:hypothetical protein K402DRAFT_69464 [Aulographum hederae CBS 113979]
MEDRGERAKRKDLDAGEASGAAFADEDELELEAALNPAKNYPRKRVAVACEVCRLRKTRCDAKRPCGFCTENGIECVYRQQNQTERQSAATDMLIRIDERLARLETLISPTASETVFTPASARRTSFETASTPSVIRPRGSFTGESYRRFATKALLTAENPDFSFRQTAGEAVTARPSILSFQSPFYLNYSSWDDTEVFYDDEMAAEEQMFVAMESCADSEVRPSARTAWHLQQKFVINFLQWMPLLEADDFVDHCRLAMESDYENEDANTCIAYLAYAISEISEDPGLQEHDANGGGMDPTLPGLAFFQKGCEILHSLTESRRRDIPILQCRLLRACYLEFSVRPLLTWDALTEIARDCMHILSSNFLKRVDNSTRESFHRIFWVCSYLLHALEALLKMHPIGLRQFHELVPLPLSTSTSSSPPPTSTNNKDPTTTSDHPFYFFFASISLRNLLISILGVVGYREGQVLYQPIIVAELRKQADEWYVHLPPSVRFPITTARLFDRRKAFLRLQYVAMHAVMCCTCQSSLEKCPFPHPP